MWGWLLLLVLLAGAGLLTGSLLNTLIVPVPGGPAPSRSGSEGRDWRAGDVLVEVANAALWVVAGLRFGPHLVLMPFLGLFSVLLALSVIDLELYILPNRITYPSILASLLVIPSVSLIVTDHPLTAIRNAVVGGLGYAAFLLVTLETFRLVARRDGMGIGDVKLALLMGLYLGWIDPVLALLSLVLSSVIGLVAGVVVLVARKGRNEPYPFGPWLALGCVLAVVFSRQLLSIYR